MISAFGDLKYPAGFKHFDYLNPYAPKGGTGASRRRGSGSSTTALWKRWIAGTAPDYCGKFFACQLYLFQLSQL